MVALPTQPPMESREVILALRHPREHMPLATHVRGTLIRASLRTLEIRGILPMYAARLPADIQDVVFKVTPGQWLGIDVALAHYQTIDSLGLTLKQQGDLGATVYSDIRRWCTETLFKMARKSLSVNPLIVMPHAQRFWDRLFKGSDVSVTRAGPKQVIVEIHGMPLARVAYFRVALRAGLQRGLQKWAEQFHVSEIEATDTVIVLRQAWV